MTTNTKLILLRQDFKNSAEVISAMSGLAKEQGLVNDAYLPAILEREEKISDGSGASDLYCDSSY